MSPKPHQCLQEHTNTVCALKQGHEPLSLISGSWDQTARIWSNLQGTVRSVELKGHEGTVWAVTPLKKDGKYATGSADKMIFVWNSTGEKLVVLKGHTDCVRDLIGLEDGSLLSCSNDASIRHWSDTYDCLREFHGHSNYIYTIALVPAFGDTFLTGSEDSTIRLWSLSEGNLGNALTLPAQTVWSVASTSEGDLIAGSSDGAVRVFTKDHQRFAPINEIAAYEQEVEQRIREQSQKLGDVNVGDIPGPESLLQDGTEGQTRLVRQRNGKIECYQWTNGSWENVGDVTGAAPSSSDKKTLHQGKAYDFVFNVDISDGVPPLKLPFNKEQDPWEAAQKFIHRENLPQDYLTQVASFIIKNAGISDRPQSSQPGDFYDPFTGEGRYIPTQAEQAASRDYVRKLADNASGSNSDPFTGGDSYSTASTSQMEVEPSQIHIPGTEMIKLDLYNEEKILEKLRQFNTEVDTALQVPDELLPSIVKLHDGGGDLDESKLSCFDRMLKWPKEKRFPVIDVVRLMVRYEAIVSKMPMPFITELISNLSSCPPNQLMSMRVFVNIAFTNSGKQISRDKLKEICEQLAKINQGNLQLQAAAATFFLNQSILQKDNPSNDICATIATAALKANDWIVAPESKYRLLLALGNLVVFNAPSVLFIIKSDKKLSDYLREVRGTLELAEIIKELKQMIL